MPAGVDANGFTKKTIEEVKKEIEDDQLSTLDPTLILDASQPIGQLNASFSKKVAELWEVAEVAYNGFDRDASEGRQLDNVGTITGTLRESARKTVVHCTVNLNSSFSHAIGALMAHVTGQETLQFTNRDAVVSTTAGNYEAVFEAVVEGETHVNAGTLTTITNAVSGWNSITNAEDGIVGALVEEDGDYRIRQDDELSAAGSSTVDAIRTDVLQVPNVLQAFCFENPTMLTNANGLPAKSIEVVIFDGLDAAADDLVIAQAIWDSKPSGSETFGSSSALATDKNGRARLVKFTRATIKDVFLEFDVTVDPTRFPIDGGEQIKALAVAKANDRSLDDDVIALAVRASVLESSAHATGGVKGVKGVTDVSELRLGFASSPTGTSNLVVTSREIASFDTSRVVVTLV